MMTNTSELGHSLQKMMKEICTHDPNPEQIKLVAIQEYFLSAQIEPIFESHDRKGE